MKQLTKRLEEITFKKSFTKNYNNNDYGKNRKITVNIRFDDQCKNGHNTFSITGEIYRPGNRDIDCGGCIHDEIKKHFPKLSTYIKWHLTSSDGPMYYVANTIYHSEEIKKGIPTHWDNKLKFKNFPMTFEYDKEFLKFLSKNPSKTDYEIVSIKHKESETYGENYTLKGFGETWYNCPFSNINTANEFLDCLKQSGGFDVVKIPTSWTEEKKPDLKSARLTAVWPNATLEQLQSETVLNKRLPVLMAEFEKAINEINNLNNMEA